MPTYNFACAVCDRTEEAYVHYYKDAHPCSKCGGATEKVWSSGVTQSGYQGYPYVTKNITGQPIEITSPAHERALCKIHGVTPRPDVAWFEKKHMGMDSKGNPIYSEGSGMGLPGVWF